MADLMDGFKGCMLGLAVGDALGMPVEGYTASEIAGRFGTVRDMMAAPEGHFHSGLKAGQYTDDTEETLILAESMIEAGGFSCNLFVEMLKDWAASWTLDDCLNRGVGLATRSSLEAMLSEKSWKESGAAVPTCGSAMRVAPIGLVYHWDLNLVSRYAELQSIPTHCSPAARAGSVAVAVGVALSLVGVRRRKVLETAVSLSAKVDPSFGESLAAVAGLLEEDPERAGKVIGSSPLVGETVPAAFYYYLRYDPEEALINAASFGGDSDSIASIAGSLAGAAFGTEWIPERWLSSLEEADRITRIAEDLARLSLRFCSRPCPPGEDG